MKAPPDFILVADGCHARLISHDARGDTLLWAISSREAPRLSRETGADQPGRAFDGAGQDRYATEQRTGPQRAAQLAFAREVADKVEETLASLSFNNFVVVAPPRTVGDLRREFCDQVLEALTNEVQKDLVALPDREVIAQLTRPDTVH